MKVLFRADASIETGTGHVIRCVTLADALTRSGAEILFACRDLPGHLNDWLVQRGHRVLRWAADSPAHLSTELRLALETERFDWLVVDHYALSADWERQLAGLVSYRLAIDDLANRPHDCDLLLDQNFFERAGVRYQEWVPTTCQLLTGPTYALLRPDFAKIRAEIQAAARRESGQIRRVQIFFGGSDPTGETQLALDVLVGLGWPELQLDVIVGASNPHQEVIKAACESLPNAAFHCQTNRMAQLMGEADLAISAGGTATWERLCVGLPALVITVADNQEQISQEVAGAGAQIYLGRSGEISKGTLEGAIRQCFADPDAMKRLSRQGMSMVDGLGAERVVSAMRASMS